MQTIQVVSFYLSLVFGFGFGMIGFFQIGRHGMFQVIQLVRGDQLPFSSPADPAENLKALAAVYDVPASPLDLLISMMGFGLFKRSADLYARGGRPKLNRPISGFPA